MNHRINSGTVLCSILLVCLTVRVAGQQEKSLSATPTRPNFTNATETVSPGTVQIEYGVTSQWLDVGGTTQAYSGTYSFGLTQRMDLRVTADHTLVSAEQHSSGDTWIGIRYRFNEQASKVPSFGFLYQIKVPTADKNRGFGSGYIDHSLALLLSKDFHALRADMNIVQFALGTPTGWGGSTLASLAISRTIRGNFGGLTEIYGGRQNCGSGAASVFTAMTYRWNLRFVSDIGIEFGLTPSVPRKRFVAGFSYALMNVHRSHIRSAAMIRQEGNKE